MTFEFPNIGLGEIETERESSSTVFREVGVDDRLKGRVVNLSVQCPNSLSIVLLGFTTGPE